MSDQRQLKTETEHQQFNYGGTSSSRTVATTSNVGTTVSGRTRISVNYEQDIPGQSERNLIGEER